MLLFMDSFDHYATADVTEKWTASAVGGAGATVAIAAAGRRSSSAFQWVTGVSTSLGSVGYVHKVLAPADATAVIGCAFALSGNPAGVNGLQLASVRNGGTVQLSLRLNSDSTVSVVRGTVTGTVLGTTSATVLAGGFVYLEWKVLLHASSGTVDLRINGSSVLSLTGQNTVNSGGASWTSFTLGHYDGQAGATSGTTQTLDFDDLYVLDGAGAAPWNTFLGDCRVDAGHPSAAGAVTDWTPSAGANYQCVDETAPNDDTDYTTTDTTNDVDTFAVSDAPTAGTIHGVQVLLNMKKTASGACSVAPIVRHAGTNQVGADLNPSSVSYAYFSQIYATNPGTGAAWTIAGFNAAEFGYKRTA